MIIDLRYPQIDVTSSVLGRQTDGIGDALV